MSRFSADTPKGRRKLVMDAITAHRERGSPFCTLLVEYDFEPAEMEDESEREGESGGEDAEVEEAPPWIQFGDQTLNLDCTDEELDRLKNLLREFPAFKIEQLESPEEAEGTNVRISAKADVNRIAQFVERTLQTVYECPKSTTVWAVEV
ncbi:hypothetical protein SAMN05421858_2073 [Haladaptatus litoreus]|uniref:DUF7975 domain-containing protein n=1 Tax=Haladaptatus litoreus TaxID=553468 RepID=A0A1N6ZLD3_9EURY|nr:hypothetical protein [Haladaptatus litoreus]SIR27506.1 hypothetical protein SAMN05421858_2073 [Haladaptatus litoreus]